MVGRENIVAGLLWPLSDQVSNPRGDRYGVVELRLRPGAGDDEDLSLCLGPRQPSHFIEPGRCQQEHPDNADISVRLACIQRRP